MKKIFFAVVLMVGTCSTAWAEWTANIDLLKPTLDTFMEGASRNDATIHEQFWHDDLTYTSSNGTRFGKQQLMQGVISAGPTAQTDDYWSWYTAEDLTYTAVDALVVINFVLVAHTESNAGYGHEEYFNSGVLVWHEGRWQALNWQATQRKED